MGLLSALRHFRVLARARRVYRIRHERLLRENERAILEAVTAAHTARATHDTSRLWTEDDIVELASLTVSRTLETERRHVRAVKAAREARRIAREAREAQLGEINGTS